MISQSNFKSFLIWLDCPDEILLDRRIKRDVPEGVDPKPSIDIVNKYNIEYKALRDSINIDDKIFLKIDTTNDFEENIQLIENEIKKQINNKEL